MGGTSRFWLLAAALVTGGAALDAAAVTLYWQPCSGMMLNGSVFHGSRFDSEFTEACRVAMDHGGQFPLPAPGQGVNLITGLGASAAILLALAWLVLLPALRVRGNAWLVAALPGLLALVLVAESVLVSLLGTEGMSEDLLNRALMLLVAISAPISLVSLVGNTAPAPLIVSAVIVALSATAPGLFAQIWDYGVMTGLSQANWDAPPGSGYVITAMLVVAAVWTWVEALWGERLHASTPMASPSVALSLR